MTRLGDQCNSALPIAGHVVSSLRFEPWIARSHRKRLLAHRSD